MISYAFSTHIGLVREKQEDAYGNWEDNFFVVADGLGGHPAGEVAANLAVEEVLKTYKRKRVKPQNVKKPEPPEVILKEVFKCANKRIMEEAKRDPTKYGMATTMVAAVVQNNKWWIGNIGDSRGYFFSKGKLQQVTIDHEESSGTLTRAVGLEEEGNPDIFSGNASSGDILLLATDGLTNFVADEKIKEVLGDKGKLATKANQLIELALDAGGLDNVTVCLIAF